MIHKESEEKQDEKMSVKKYWRVFDVFVYHCSLDDYLSKISSAKYLTGLASVK